jgi:hypothetical protein
LSLGWGFEIIPCVPSFAVGESVLVPAACLPDPDAQPYALVPRTVLAQVQRKVRVDDGVGGTVEVASRLVHRATIGFLVLRIGDLSTEVTLLDPLARSVLQFLRLLVPDEDVRSVSLRTLHELDVHWSAYHGATSHVILIGHGSATSISFIDGGAVAGDVLAGRLEQLAPNTHPKTFVSLACLTGRAGFAKAFSKNPICRDFIGPFQSVHGAAASRFCQRLLAEHLLEGVEIPFAYARAAKGLEGGRRFRRWRDGSLKTIAAE